MRSLVFKSRSFWETCQKIIAVIVCVSMVWAPVAINVKAEEDSFTRNGVKYQISEGELIAYGYDESSFPADGKVTLDKETVHIDEGAFSKCDILKRIETPEGLLTIGDGAFEGCSSLDIADLSKGVIAIGDGAFEGCSGLKYVFLKDGMEYMGGNAFSGCSRLTSVTLPEGIESIAMGTFKGCSSLEDVEIPKSVTKIEDCVFEGCSSLTNIDIPEGAEVSYYTFSGCSRLTRIMLPIGYDVSLFSKSLFMATDGSHAQLDSFVVYENGNTFENGKTKGKFIFYVDDTQSEGGKPIRYYVENGVLYKRNLARTFVACGYDKSSFPSDGELTFDDEIACPIDVLAFAGCELLKSIKIPDSIDYIGAHAFGGCPNLTSVDLGHVKTIMSYAFRDCSSLEHVTIPSTVKNIYRSVFKGCHGLKSVCLSEGVESIPQETFKNCGLLTNIEIPKSVKYIGPNAFENCHSLPSIEIPEGATVGDDAFARCDQLTQIMVPKGYNVSLLANAGITVCDDGQTFRNSMYKQGKFVFYEDYEDWECGIPVRSYLDDGICYEKRDGNLCVMGYSENGFPSDGHVTLDEKTVCIVDGAFSDCTLLKSIEIPKGVIEIGTSAFEGCSSLLSVELPEGIESIEMGTFKDCSSLKSVKIPESVKKIEDGAFESCSSLTSIEIPKGAEVGRDTFTGCRRLTQIMVHKGYDVSLFDWPMTWALTLEHERLGVFSVSPDGKTFSIGGTQGEFIFYEDITPPGGKPIRHYVDSKGETSVKITGNGMFWLREESTDVYTGKTTHAWYGIDNTEGLFAKDSRFYVQWISRQENPEEYMDLLVKFDMRTMLAKGWEESGYIFKVGVIGQDGTTKYTDLNGKTVKLYVQLGDDWNKNSLKAYWIGSGNADDQSIAIASEKREAPEEGTYGILTLKHFSPYIVFDDLLEGEEEDTDDSQLQVIDLENGKATNAAKNTSGSGVSSGSQKQTGDVTSIVFIGVLGILTMLSATYLMIQKKKNSSKL